MAPAVAAEVLEAVADDVALELGGRSARDFASQGQQRAFVLAWKVAEIENLSAALGFLPLSYDDFIGGTIGEEWGFVGLTVLIALFALWGWLGFRIAAQARTTFQRLAAIGITTTRSSSATLPISGHVICA